MMSSSYPTLYPQIDHRSVFKSPAQLETTNCCPTISPSGSTNSSKETLIADIFSPITDFPHTAELAKAKGTIPTTTKVDAPFSNLPSTPLNASCVTTSRRRPSSSLASLSGTKTKIPHPLTTIWSNRNTFHFRGKVCGNCCNVSVAVGGGGVGGSLRLRGTKSNLPPLIMEPAANETALPSVARVECTHRNTHDSTTTPNVGQTGGSRFYTARRKLALITQKPSADPQLERSLSLRKNFKYSPKTDSPLEKPSKSSTVEEASCAAAGTAPNITTLSAGHDDVEQSVTKDSYKVHGEESSSAATTTKIMENQTISPDPTMVNGKLSRECRKMSLNQNGLHTSSAAATTPTTTTTAATTPHHQHQQQHTRPITLATSASASTPITSGGNGAGAGGSIKTPKSPRPATGNGTHIPQPQQHHSPSPQESQPTHSNNKALGTGQGGVGVGGLKLTPKTPPVTPDSPSTYLDDDLDSLYSYTTTSGRSTMSCEHPYVARNGTTFSGRKMKYVVHCSNYAGQVGADYLTPTQRAQRQIRRLKELLCVARQDLEQKDSELLRLTREVVELRLFKASLSSPDERSASSDAVTVREAELKTSQDVSPIVDMVDDAQKQHSGSPTRHMHGGHPHHHHHVGHATSASPTVMIHPSQNSHHHHNHHHDMQSSFADSGHFEDLTSSSVHSKDSSYAPSSHGHHERACSAGVSSGGIHHDEASSSTLEQYELQRQELIRLYEQRIEDLVRSQDAVATDIKRSNNDRIEALLQKLAECNTRYADIVPDYEHAKERIRELEKQLEDLQRKLAEHEEKQKQMYLHMYQKGQEAERIARADQALELAHRAPQNKVSINELLHQLQSTQDELENIRAAECRNECRSNHALLTAKEAISLWVLGARKTIYRRLLEAQKNRTHVDPEVTLQFLKSAVYYFLTDKENSQGHLQAIESILEFSEAEKQVINKARASK